MTRKILAATLAASLAATSLHADQHEPAPQPTMEGIEQRTMGGSFPVETVVTFVLLGIIAAAISANNSSGGGASVGAGAGR
ncbi:hypothetical protein [Histidinibacterium aquaticum]|uniref:Ferrochelatase n=1 Tax=Histidinibacterium aquaticum TaxID=2613962 RepID=A0A5J5GFW6_9RHOB|nr:hypothetical protein [Histidinibacterium aquaticum]KAA9006900.1 hypothetical protein F3S47_14105 [Histidinibacterium aquaticum]